MPLRCARKARSDGTKYVFCTGSKFKRLRPSYLKKNKTSKKTSKRKSASRKTKTKKASPAKAASPRRSKRTRKAPSRLGF